MKILLRTYLYGKKIFKFLRFIVFIAIVSMIGFSTNAFATHPLITDDTGTQGKAGIQIELNGEYGTGKEDGVTEKTTEIAGAFTYGLTDSLDLIAGIPYLFTSVESEGETVKEKGISDASLQAKWRFYEIGKFSFALKPGISLPTGDEQKGLGTNKIGYSGFLINTINIEPFAFHLNFGYMRNEKKFEEENNLWHASAACEYSILKNLRVVVNIGMEKNSDPDATDNPAFILGGIIYSVKYNIDLDAGFKYGLNKPEVDYSLLAGITIKI
jgi:hypothetical protein